MKKPKRKYTFTTMDGDTLTFEDSRDNLIQAVAVKIKGEPVSFVGASHSWRGAQQIERPWWRLPTIEKSYIAPCEEVKQ